MPIQTASFSELSHFELLARQRFQNFDIKHIAGFDNAKYNVYCGHFYLSLFDYDDFSLVSSGFPCSQF